MIRYAYFSILGRAIQIFILVFIFAACGTKELPINELRKVLQNTSDYSIILEDMKIEGNFAKSYYHKYRVIQDEKKWTTEWLEVPRNYFMANENFIGMTLATRVDGKDTDGVAPPGYAYVGNPRYGRWSTDRYGNSFWEFYGKYRLFSDLFGGWYRPVYRSDYSAYNDYRNRRTPFFGRNHEFGTSGSVVKKAQPTFFERRMQQQRQKSMSFKERVSKRIGRTRTSFRGRSGGIGK